MRLLTTVLAVALAFTVGVFAERDFGVVDLVKAHCQLQTHKCACKGNCDCCKACPGQGNRGKCTCDVCKCCRDCSGHNKTKGCCE